MPKVKRRRRGNAVDATGRSKGGDSHVRFHHWELRSLAFRSLSLGGRALLLELKALFNGTNNGELFLSVREAARRMGVGKNLAASCFAELQERGFIRPNRPGSFNWKDGSRRGMATSWILTEFSFAGALPTKDFMRWHPPPPASTPRRTRRMTVPAMGTASPPCGDTQLPIALDCPRDRDTLAAAAVSDGPSKSDTGKLPSGVSAIDG